MPAFVGHDVKCPGRLNDFQDATPALVLARCGVVLAFVFLASVGCGRTTKSPHRAAALASPASTATERPYTFNRDIAPLIWQHCSDCHRPGEAAPFSLLSYDDVRKRAGQIVEVTGTGYMPPWLAETTEFPLEDDLKLSQQQRAMLARWVESGAPEGRAEDLPTPPHWTEGWNLGEPDLVVQMERPFLLPAEGTDVYRNFVVPVPLDRPRYVRAMEFRPGNYRLVHHAFIMTDPTRRLRRVAGADGQPGFEGMETQGAEPPGGHFIGWQPGRRPYVAPEGTAWRLVPGTDLVIQVHMQPIGKEEPLQVSVGFYFTDEAPTKHPLKIGLRSIDIDIPPGTGRYRIHDELVLPVEVQVLAVAPHAHYLGKEMYGRAILPDGTEKTLFAIKNWDPNWQREYRFRTPFSLPAGTKLVQEFYYDNTADNPRNPNSPPQRVRYGLQATDEMGSLWFQVLPQSASDTAKLQRALAIKGLEESKTRFTKALREDPNDLHALIEMGKIALVAKQSKPAEQLFRRATMVDANSPDAHYYLGQLLLREGKVDEGRLELERSLAIDDQYVKALHDLGWSDVLAKDWTAAERRFRQALEIHPYDARVLEKLGIVLMQQGRPADALATFERALESDPTSTRVRQHIEDTRSKLRGGPRKTN